MVNWDQNFAQRVKHVKVLGMIVMYQESFQELVDMNLSLLDEITKFGDREQNTSLRLLRKQEEFDALKKASDEAISAFREFERSVQSLTQELADVRILLDEATAQLQTHKDRQETVELMLAKYRAYRNATLNKEGPKRVRTTQREFYDSLDTIEVMVNTPITSA